MAVVALWSAVYLGGLGVEEFSYDETRRVFPAEAMAASGDWVNPVFEGRVYERKPPMCNWLIAVSFAVFGPSEAAARLPGAALALALALYLLWARSGWLDTRARVLAALACVASVPMQSKAHEAGIDASYAVCTAMAVLAWANGWSMRREGAALWCLPACLLGVAFLLKGPAAMLLFYLCVTAIWRSSGEGPVWRRLAAPGHLAFLALALTPFGLWLGARLMQTAPEDLGSVLPLAGHKPQGMAATWWTELSQRIMTNPEDGRSFKFSKWLSNAGSGIAGMLPWIAVLPWSWHFSGGEGRSGAIVRGLARGTAFFCLAIALMPLTKPRYFLPAAPLAAALSAVILTGLAWQGEHAGRWRERWSKGLACLGRVMAALTVLAGLAGTGAALAGIMPARLQGWSAGDGLLLTALGLGGGAVLLWWRRTPQAADGGQGWRLGVESALLLGFLLSVAGLIRPHLDKPEEIPAACDLLRLLGGNERCLFVHGLAASRPLFYYMERERGAAGLRFVYRTPVGGYVSQGLHDVRPRLADPVAMDLLLLPEDGPDAERSRSLLRLAAERLTLRGRVCYDGITYGLYAAP